MNNSAGASLLSNQTVGGTLTLTSGTFAVGANTLTQNGPAIAGMPTNLSTTSSSSLVFGGSSAGVIVPSSVAALNNLTINNSNGVTFGGSPTLSGTLTLTSGTFAVGANTLTQNGPGIAGTPTNLSTTSSSSLVFGGSSAGVSVPSSVAALNNLTVNNSTGVSLNGALDVYGTLTITGLLADAGNTLTVRGNVNNSGIHSGTGRILLSSGSAEHTLSGSGTYGNLELNDGLGAKLTGNPTVTGTLTVASGTFALNARTLTLGTGSASGSVVVNGGKFSAIGTPTDAVATVTAANSEHPYSFKVNSGTIAARDARFEYMDTDGIWVTDGAAVEPGNNFSFTSFDHGSSSGPMLRVDTDDELFISDIAFSGTSGTNIEKLLDRGHITVSGGSSGTRWGFAYESDPHGQIDWLAQKPSAVVLVTPGDGEINVPENGDLTWTGGTDAPADSFCVYLGTSNPPPLYQGNVSGSPFSYSGLDNQGLYYWFVLAKSGAGDVSSDTFSFRVALAAPELTAPGDGELEQEPDVQLSWSSPFAPSHWTVFLGKDDPTPDSVTDVTSPYYVPSPLLQNGGHYYWTVAAKDAHGQRTECSETRDFFVKLGAPVQTAPGNGTTGQPLSGKLEWEGGAGATRWTVFFGETTPPDSVTDVTVPEYSYSGAYSKKYYWKIAAKDEVGQRTESDETWNFETMAEPEPRNFSLLSPSGPGIDFTNIEFSWEDASPMDGIKYDLYLVEGTGDPRLEPEPYERNVTRPWTFTGALKPSTTYRWDVLATYLADGNPKWSNGSLTFVTKNEPVPEPKDFNLTAPANGAPNQPVTGITFTWEDANPTDAVSYEVWLGEPGALVKVKHGLVTPSWTYDQDPLAFNTTYEWNVRAFPGTGKWALNGPRRFTTAAEHQQPKDFNLTAPAHGAIDQPITGITFTWENANPIDGVSYEVWLGTPGSLAKVKAGLSGTSWTYDLTPFAYNTTYEWDVKAVLGTSKWSTNGPRSFTTVARTPGQGEGWLEVQAFPSATKAPKAGAWLALGPDNTGNGKVIYAARGNKTSDFYKYYPEKDSWKMLGPIPDMEPALGKLKPVSKGSRAVSDGKDYLYMLKGNGTQGFWRYRVEDGKWDTLTRAPQKIKGGDDLAYVEWAGKKYVYLLAGGKTAFFRFDVESGQWSILDSAPFGNNKKKYGAGSFLAYNRADAIYAHQANVTGDSFHYMFRYDLAKDSWDKPALKGLPLYGNEGGKLKKKKSKDGAGAVWYDDGIYAVKGGGSQGFYSYNPNDGSWTPLETIPRTGSGGKKTVKAGGSLVSWGDSLYLLKAGNTHEFWRWVKPLVYTRPNTIGRDGKQAGKSAIGGLQLAVSPNPIASGFATVRFGRVLAEPVSVRVYDALGRVVLTQSVPTSPGVLLDLRRLSAGVYLVRLDAAGLAASQKLVVQK